MLLTTEMVEILKTVSIFSGTPDETLAEVASLLAEVSIQAGETIFEKGEKGSSMYIIVDGQVLVHDGERRLNQLGERDVFGEMALVDSASRLASVTAIEDTRLLRLDQESFQKLMYERPEVVHGIMRVLSRHLRDRVQDLDELRTHLQQVILPLGIALSSETNLDRLLERILMEAQSLCHADAATLYLLSEDDHLRFTIMHTHSLGIALGGTTGKEILFSPLPLYDETTGEPNHHNVCTHVALNGQSISIPDIYHAEEFDFSGAKAFDRQNKYRSISTFAVPLKNHVGDVIGVLQLFNAQDPKTGEVVPFDAYQQLVVESLTSQAAISLNTQMLLRRQEELLKLEHDLQIGRQVQAYFLPEKLPEPPGWEVAARFQPAREVAGDFYDFFPLADGKAGLVMADVVDKGVGAALFMALSHTLIRASAEQQVSLSDSEFVHDVVKLTSDYIATHHSGSMFVTLFFGVLDIHTGLLTYVNAGHNPPLVVNSAGAVKSELKPTGPAVGLFPFLDFDSQQLTFEPGDLLMTFTDGVPEARGPDGEFFGEERLLSLLQEPASSASTLLDRVEASLQDHLGDAEQSDDVTMLAVRRAPTSEV